VEPETTIEVRESDRARRISLRALADGRIEVVVPRGTHRRHVDRAVAEARPWITSVRERRRRAPTLGLARPGVIWEHGLPACVDAISARAIDQRYRSFTRDFLDATIPEIAARMGVTPARWAVRAARGRWGSCTHTRQTLSFNWRLSLVPLPVARHVVVHELAHLRHPDHGARFWALVQEHDPDTRAHRAWLRTHGAEVMAYDPAVAIR
jgi:predicted metal-dependent hydrolase